MCVRTSPRSPVTLIDVDALLADTNWRGQDADSLKARLRAPTLRLICRELGIRPARPTINECARAIAQHSADLDMGRI